MNQATNAHKKTAYAVRFDGPKGPELVIHVASTASPKLEGVSIPVSRRSMASIVRRWRSLGAPYLVRGISYGTTALLSMARMGKLELSAQ